MTCSLLLRFVPLLSLTVLAAGTCTMASAQCTFSWPAGAPSPGPSGTVETVLPLPNGDLVVGGYFRVADATIVNNVARWDGSTWRALGAGTNGYVSSLVRLANGDLVAAGSFTEAGGQTCNRVARWNGTSWSPVGTGLDNTVNALLVLPNGNLIAGGDFLAAGALAVRKIARWNGTAWSPIGTGFTSGSVRSLATAANGDIVAAGQMVVPTFAPYGLQRWDGTNWVQVPGFDPGPYFDDLVRLANGDLVVSGQCAINGVPAALARCDGISAQALVPPVVGYERTLLAASNGDLWFGVQSASTSSGLARWNGATWSSIAGAPSRVATLAEDGIGRILTGGSPGTLLVPQHTVRRYDGAAWQLLGAATPPVVSAMTRLPNGDVVVGGLFTSFSGVAANCLARWDGSSWSPLGLGVDGQVTGLCVAPNGDVLVSGSFANAGGSPAERVARWNGQAWSTLGNGLPVAATSLVVSDNGDVIAASAASGFGVPRRFDGLQWTPLAFPGGAAVAHSLAKLPNGDVVFGGVFSGFPGIVGAVLYANGTLSAIPGAPALGFVTRLFVDDAGDVIAYGQGGFGLRRWDGVTWTVLPSVVVGALGQLPNGELIVGSDSLLRLRPTGWESFGELAGGGVSSLVVSGRGEVFAGGTLETAAGVVSYGLAHGVPTCPAATSVVGSGCSGGAGPVTLAADGGAWAGGTFRAMATGMTNNSLAVQIFGVQPVQQALPGGAAGCSLYVAPMIFDLQLPAGGIVRTAYVLPAQPSLAGQQLRMQVIGVELGAAGIVRLTSTNALQLTIGAL